MMKVYSAKDKPTAEGILLDLNTDEVRYLQWLLPMVRNSAMRPPVTPIDERVIEMTDQLSEKLTEKLKINRVFGGKAL